MIRGFAVTDFDPMQHRATMRLGRLRRVAIGASAALLLFPLSFTSIHGESEDPEDRHWTGLALVGPEVMQISPRDEAQAVAISAAIDLALKNPQELSFPWIDEGGDVLQLSAASDLGVMLLDSLAPTLDVPTAIRQVEHSLADLNAVKWDVSQFREFEAQSILRTLEPDWRDSRLVATVSQIDDEVFKALADRFGTEILAVRVDPERPLYERQEQRRLDVNPFTGGARIVHPRGCSNAF